MRENTKHRVISTMSKFGGATGKSKVAITTRCNSTQLNLCKFATDSKKAAADR